MNTPAAPRQSVCKGDRGLRRHVTAGCVAALAFLAIGFAGYLQAFTSFACYDDEGYVMVSLRAYLTGQPLYDDVFSQYGPFYYQSGAVFHRLTSLPVTHDVARFKTLAIWLIVALLSGVFVFRVTRHGWLSLFALLAVFFHLDRLGLESGHPQDVCVLLVAASLLLASFVDVERIRAVTSCGGGSLQFVKQAQAVWPLVLLGVLTGCLAMTKINVGGLLGAALSVAILLATVRGRIRNAMLALCVLSICLLPLVLMRSFLLESQDGRLAWLICGATGLAVWVAWKQPSTASLPLRSVFQYWGGFLAAFAVTAAVALIQGTTLAGLADGLVLHHLSFGTNCFKSAPVFLAAIPAMGFAAWLAASGLNRSSTAERIARLAVMVLLLGAAVRYLLDTFVPILHGAEDRGLAALLLSLFAPWVWIVLWPGGASDQQSRETAVVTNSQAGFARIALCFVAVLQPLIAFPIPGTQMAIGTMGLLLSAIIALADAVRTPGLLGSGDGFLRRGMVPICCLLALLTAGCRDLHFWNYRANCLALELPGAQRLHLPPREVARHRWVVDQLRTHSETFIGVPNGYNSYYMWAELSPPSSLMTTDWPHLLHQEEQASLAASLAARGRVCVVFDEFLGLPPAETSPLTRHVLAGYEPFATFDHLQIWRSRGWLASEANE